MNRTTMGRSILVLFVSVSLFVSGEPALGAKSKSSLDIDGELNEARRKVDSLVEKLRFLQKEYGGKRSLSATKGISLERRTNDGQVFFLTGDYVRAAIIFYDLVENPEYAKRPGHDERVFYLAESMFKNRNFLGARKYYKQLADKGPSNRFFFKVLPRLVEVAASLNEYSGVDKYFSMLEGKPRSEVGEDIYYIHAKSLFDRGKLTEADKEFAAFPPDSPYAKRAKYFRGVVAVARGPKHYEEALEFFRSVATTGGNNEEEKAVADLAKLAEGRVLLEMGRVEKALDAYQAIDRFSPYFGESLYEIAWAWIRSANAEKDRNKQEDLFAKALDTLDILLAALPDGKLLAKAKLLRGDLFLRIQKLKEAEGAYEGVLEQFEPVKMELEKIIAEHDDPKRYFNEIMGGELKDFDVSSFLPPLAVKWAQKSDEVQRALQALKDLKAGRKMLEETKKMIDELRAAAEESTEQGVMPRQKEVRDRVLALVDQANDLKRKLAEIETEILLKSKIEKAGRQGVEEQEKVVSIHKELPELDGELEAISVLLKAAAKWCADTEIERGLSPDEKRFCQERVYGEMRKIKELDKETESAKSALKAALSRKGLDDWVRYEEARAERKRLEKLVAKLPKTLEGVKKVDKEIGDRLKNLQQELLKLGYELDSMEEQLKAIEKWRRETYSKRKISEKHEKAFKEKVANELATVRSIKGIQKEVFDKVTGEIAKVSIMGSGSAGDNQAIRAAYEKALAREKELFHKLRGNLDAEGQRKVAEIDRLRAKLDELGNGVRGFLKEMGERTNELTDTLAVEVERAQKELEDYMAEVGELEESAEVTAGSVAYESFKDVREQFYKLVLRADVGLIDVAWATTELQNKEREELVKKKADEMRALYQKYQEVTEELQ